MLFISWLFSLKIMKHFEYKKINIDKISEIVYNNYCEENNISNTRTKNSIDKAFEIIKRSARPEIIWKTFPIINDNSIISLHKKKYIITSKKMSNIFLHCDEVAVCAITLGNKIDKKIKSKKLKMYEQMVLDDMASSVIDAVMEISRLYIGTNISYDKSLTNTYSPGYCDWDLSQQKMIFSLLPHNALEIELSSSLLMKPRKSIISLIGIGDSKTIQKYGNTCSSCGDKKCDFRRKHDETNYI